MTAPESQTRRYQSHSNVHQSSPGFMKFLCLIQENLGMFAIYFHSQIIIKYFKSEFTLVQIFLWQEFAIQSCLKLSFSVSFKD